MDYSQLSDFEINVMVFEALYRGSPDCKEGDVGEMLFVSFEVDVVDGDMVEIEVVRGSFNPCNKWSDAGTIIADNGINILWDWNENGLHGASANPIWEYEHENVLRAAMIVFLMMQDANHA